MIGELCAFCKREIPGVRIDFDVAVERGLLRRGGRDPWQWVMTTALTGQKDDSAHIVRDIVSKHATQLGQAFKVSQLRTVFLQRVGFELDVGDAKLSDFVAAIPGLQLLPENGLPNMLISCVPSSSISRDESPPSDKSSGACQTTAGDATAVFHKNEQEFLSRLKAKLAEFPAGEMLEFAALKEVMRTTWASLGTGIPPLTNGLMSKVHAKGFRGYIASILVDSILKQPEPNGCFHVVGGDNAQTGDGKIVSMQESRAWADPQEQNRQGAMQDWNVSQVADFVELVCKKPHLRKACIENEIDGQILLEMTDADVSKFLQCTQLVATMICRQVKRSAGELVCHDVSSTPLFGLELLAQVLESNTSFCAYDQAKAEYWETYDRLHGYTYNKDLTRPLQHSAHLKKEKRQAMYGACKLMLEEILNTDHGMAWHDFSMLACKTVLNLCSAPGGFDAVLIENFPEATITSISLPPADGGTAYLGDSHEHIKFYELDVVKAASSSWPSSEHDLVILGGSMSAGDGACHAKNVIRASERLLTAQCCVAYRCLRRGGRVLLRTTGPHNPLAASIICSLMNDFDSTAIYKPSPESSGAMWHNSFVYVMFDGFCLPSSVAHSKSSFFAGLAADEGEQSMSDLNGQVEAAEGVLSPELASQLTMANIQKLCSTLDDAWQAQAHIFRSQKEVVTNKKWVPCGCGKPREKKYPQCGLCWRAIQAQAHIFCSQ